MTQSMTAFSRIQRVVDAGLLIWEIRSVNHRYLDVSFRLPEGLRFLEPSLRGLIRGRLNRGKIECQLKYQDTIGNNPSMLINKEMVNLLVDLAGQISSSHQLTNDFTVSHLLAWPGVVSQSTLDMEQLGDNALVLFQEAIEQLSQARANEGKALQALVEERLNNLGFEIGRARALVGLTAQQTKEKLDKRLRVLHVEVAPERLAQELALILVRFDVSEELDRLDTHVKEVGRILKTEGGAGRTLDFLMQELNREANTLSAKSDSVQLTQSAVAMKVLIEQMREQIQNIE